MTGAALWIFKCNFQCCDHHLLNSIHLDCIVVETEISDRYLKTWANKTKTICIVRYFRSKRKYASTFGRFIIEGQHYSDPQNSIWCSSHDLKFSKFTKYVRLNYEEMYCIKVYYLMVHLLQIITADFNTEWPEKQSSFDAMQYKLMLSWGYSLSCWCIKIHYINRWTQAL